MLAVMNMTPDGRISVSTQAGPVMVTKDHHAYAKIVEAFHADDVDQVLKLISSKEMVEDYVSPTGMLFVRNSDIWVKVPSRIFQGRTVERRLNNDAARYLLQFLKRGQKVDTIAAVIARCYSALTDELADAAFTFIFQNDFETPLSLLPDGRFMGYKRVRPDFTDVYSGTVQYTPLEHAYPDLQDQFAELIKHKGAMVYEFEEKLRVGDGCGGGLHMGNYEYVRTFAASPENPVISVIGDPADVVGYSSAHRSHGKLRFLKLECGFILNNEALTPSFNEYGPSDVDTDEEGVGPARNQRYVDDMSEAAFVSQG